MNQAVKPSDLLPALNQGIVGKSAIDSPGEIISNLLPLLFTIAGIILLLMIIMGGFTLLTSGVSPDNAEKGKAQITNAIIGFILLFVSYWIAQIIQVFTGINILGK